MGATSSLSCGCNDTSENTDERPLSWLENNFLGEVRKKLEDADQAQVFECLDKELIESREFIDASGPYLQRLNATKANEIFADSMKGGEEETGTPMPVTGFASTVTASDADKAGWNQVALDAYAAGKVGLLVLAGGQGTRLGFDRPKGEFVLDLPAKKSIFQLFAERVQKLQMLAAKNGDKVVIPLYVMTSPQTHEQTVGYFNDNKYFGLEADAVFFFQQGTLPCFTNEGKFMMEGDYAEQVAQAPDGNGGFYSALHTAQGEGRDITAMQDMKQRGVEGIMVFAVDNAICKVGDPQFVGYCLGKNAELGVKVVPKANADEKVGHLVTVDGKYKVIEYSEISDELKNSKNPDGGLKFNAGSVCIHYYSVEFLDVKCNIDSLPTSYHVARKKIPHSKIVGKTVQKVTPTENNGVKLEIFIFDVFPYAQSVAVFESQRAEEFSPVKNKNKKDEVDCPDTAKNIISSLHKSWLEAAGATLEGDGILEVSPLVSYAGEGLEAVKGKTIKIPAAGLAISDLAKL